MSGWEASDVGWFLVIACVLIFVGRFITNFIALYPIVRAEHEAKKRHIEEYELFKHIPPSMKADGQVDFVSRSEESIGEIDGQPIYKSYVDTHGLYWVFDGIGSREMYSQRKDDPTVRVFIGKCLYRLVSDQSS